MAVAENWEDHLLDAVAEKAPETKSPVRCRAPEKAPKDVEDTSSSFIAERERTQKLVEEAEKRLMEDLLMDCPRNAADVQQVKTKAAKPVATTKGRPAASSADPFAAVFLRTQAECERFCNELSKKISESPANSQAWLRFLDLLTKECCLKMDLKDLKSFSNKVNSYIKEKEKAVLVVAEKKKKPNTVSSMCRNYQDEIDIVEGADLEDEEDEEDENDEDEDEDSFI